MIRHPATKTRGHGALFIALAVVVGCIDTAWSSPIVIPVRCGGESVGNISVDAKTFPSGARGVDGQFESTVGDFDKLKAAATKCGEDHFNWYQVVVSDTQPPVDASGKRVTAPYIDPPPGGFGNAPDTAADETVWGDKLPWHFNETLPPPDTKGYVERLQLERVTLEDSLLFQDAPNSDLGTTIIFRTWLVSLNADSSFHAWHAGFEWRWQWTSVIGPPDVTFTRILTDPTRANYNDLLKGFDQKLTPVPEPGTCGLVVLGLLALTRRAFQRVTP